jgi:exodeoxyribonuclease VII small subunit
MNYEEILKELETILTDMESSDINLDEMMIKYKRALSLYKDLEKYLNDYKREIKLITDEGMEDFEANEYDEIN